MSNFGFFVIKPDYDLSPGQRLVRHSKQIPMRLGHARRYMKDLWIGKIAAFLDAPSVGYVNSACFFKRSAAQRLADLQSIGVAEILQISEDKARRLMHGGRIRYIRIAARCA